MAVDRSVKTGGGLTKANLGKEKILPVLSPEQAKAAAKKLKNKNRVGSEKQQKFQKAPIPKPRPKKAPVPVNISKKKLNTLREMKFSHD